MFTWPSKDPDETVDFSMDWSRYLNDQATISSVTWFVDNASGTKTELASVNDVVNGIQFVGKSNTNTVATINVALGTNNFKYNRPDILELSFSKKPKIKNKKYSYPNNLDMKNDPRNENIQIKFY